MNPVKIIAKFSILRLMSAILLFAAFDVSVVRMAVNSDARLVDHPVGNVASVTIFTILGITSVLIFLLADAVAALRGRPAIYESGGFLFFPGIFRPQKVAINSMVAPPFVAFWGLVGLKLQGGRDSYIASLFTGSSSEQIRQRIEFIRQAGGLTT